MAEKDYWRVFLPFHLVAIQSALTSLIGDTLETEG